MNRYLKAWAVACMVVLLTSAARAAKPQDCFTWTKVTTSGPAPQVRAFSSSAVIGRRVYVFGGLREDLFNFTTSPHHADVREFDTKTATWSLLPSGGLPPQARAGATMVAVGHTLYVAFGGTYELDQFFTHTLYDFVVAYDTKKGTWSPVMPVSTTNPAARFGAAAAAHDGKLYVFGGLGDDFSLLGDLWAFDLREKTWTEFSASPAPPPRRDSVLLAIQGSLLLLGGEVFDGSGFVPTADVWAYDIATGQ